MKYPGGYGEWTCNVAVPDTAKEVGEPKRCVGNPCDPATGNKYEVETDYLGSGPQALVFRRYYNSLYPRLGTIGINWRHTYDRQLVLLPLPTPTGVRAVRPDAREVGFSLSGSVWVPEADVVQRLERLGDNTWRLTNEDDEIENYDANGRLLSITSRTGLVQRGAQDLRPGL